MEYYTCSEEGRICYVRGRFERCVGPGLRRYLGIVEWGFVGPVPDVASVLTRLAEKYGMKGKRVNLIAGRGVRMMSFATPKVGRNAMKRVAANEMSLLDPDFGNYAVVLDLRVKAGKTMADVTTYYMGRRSLDAYKEVVEDRKMICGRVLVLPGCMVIMARELWGEERVLLLNVNQASMGFYVSSGGYCSTCRMTGLKVDCFLREGVADIFCEKMAEQVEDLIQGCTAVSDVPVPDCIVLMASCIPDAQATAEYMSERFKVPCSVRMPEPVGAICLAVCVADSLEGERKTLELEERGCEGGEDSILGRGPLMIRGWALFLLADGLAAAELLFHAAYADHAAGRALAKTKYVMEGTGYKTRVRKSMEMEERIGGMLAGREETRAEKALLARENLLGMSELRAFTEAMNPETRTEPTSSDDERPYLQMMVSMDRSEDTSAYVGRMKHSGTFRQVGHSLREKSAEGRETERIHATIYGTLGMGGQDEA